MIVLKKACTCITRVFSAISIQELYYVVEIYKTRVLTTAYTAFSSQREKITGRNNIIYLESALVRVTLVVSEELVP